MAVLRAFLDGLRRVNSAPAVLGGTFVVTLLLALLLGVSLRETLRSHLGDSAAADLLASGFNADWWQEFSSQAGGIGQTFSPSVIGFEAVLANISAFLDNESRSAVLVTVGVVYVTVWAFLIGGILDRYARQRPTRSAGFFSACGVFFFRFARLAVIAGATYAILFGYVHGWLLDDFYGWLTRDFTVERSAFVARAVLYGLFGTLLIACNLVLDYAKIRAVVEDRRSMIGATLAALRFFSRRPVATVSLYVLNGWLFVLVLLAYYAIAPGAGDSGVMVWLGFFAGQVYVLARLWAKLVFYASQTAFFQGALAHAAYTASPQPVWPESPAAEAISRTSV